MISWVSFWLDPAAVPGRTTMGTLSILYGCFEYDIKQYTFQVLPLGSLLSIFTRISMKRFPECSTLSLLTYGF